MGVLRYSRWLTGGVMVIGLAISASAAAAQSTARALEGTYRFLPAESDDVRAAIDAATDGGSFFVRKVGRGVLRRTLKPSSVITIAFDSGGVSLTDDAGRMRVPFEGGIEARNARGEREKVTVEVSDNTLIRTFRASKGTRLQRYALSAPDKVDIDVEVTGSMLPRPLRYRLRYERLSEEK